MIPSDIASRGIELHERLREFLLAEMPHERAPAIALALLYELVSILASLSETNGQALGALRAVMQLAEEQIAEFGVGHPHP